MLSPHRYLLCGCAHRCKHVYTFSPVLKKFITFMKLSMKAPLLCPPLPQVLTLQSCEICEIWSETDTAAIPFNTLKHEFHLYALLPHRKCIILPKANLLIPLREIISMYSENCNISINIFSTKFRGFQC
jgi:hypothetical protein